MGRKLVDRKGERNYNVYGTLMEIVIYNSSSDIWVEFQDKYKTRVHTDYRWFKKGEVKNPYDRIMYNIGFLGKGKYEPKEYKTEYREWCDMLKRCYDPYYLNKKPTYINCYVCEEWHCFQNFAQWWEENNYNYSAKLVLDKDILIKDNKIYSPKTCLIVPERINALFIKQRRKRGSLLIGCSRLGNSIQVSCRTLEKQVYLGLFSLNKPFQAFYTYKVFKENYIKQVADEYKNLIPTKLYDALYEYEVEIND